jgi:hypothetical protein
LISRAAALSGAYGALPVADEDRLGDIPDAGSWVAVIAVA